MIAIPKGFPDAWLPPRLTAGQIVLDVGANVGIFAEAVAATGAHVYAMEPDPRCWPELSARKGMITVIPHAAAQFEGEADLTQGASHTGSSLRPSAVLAPIGTVRVRMLPVEAIAPDRVDVVKIDTQGSEFDVLCGAGRLLQTCPLWIVEVWPWGLPAGARTVRAMVEMFRLHDLWPFTLEPDPWPLSEDDLLAWVEQTSPNSFVNLAWM